MRGRCKLESSHRAPRAHGRQTRAWNSAGEEPPGLFEELPPEDTEHPCWTGNWAIPAAQQGVVVLGSPMGSREFIATKLAQRLKKPGPSPESDAACAQPAVGVMDFAVYCAAPRSTYLLRTLSPTDTADFAASHDAAIQHSLAQMLAGGDGDKPLPELSHRRAQPPLSMGGLGLASAGQQRHAAYWSSWADTARALRQLQPCANVGENGGGCRRPRRPHHSPGPRRKIGLAANGIQSPAQARSRRFSLSLTPRLERCCCRKVAMRRAAPSRLSPRVPTPECRTMSSESCCSADSAYLSRSPRNAAPAGDSWTCTATTGRPAHRWECWRGELAPWSGQRLASARSPVPASHRMSPSATSTSMCPRATDAVLRWSPTAFPYGRAHKSPWTQPS